MTAKQTLKRNKELWELLTTHVGKIRIKQLTEIMEFYATEQVKKFSLNVPVMRCRHDFNRLVGFKGKSRIMRCRKCGERKVSGGVA